MDTRKADAAGNQPVYIFVHGLSGWGSYDEAYRRMPYWGMMGGDLMKYLREQGFPCYAASVAPEGSAWDRACELYAQLAGVRTYYGKAHSERYHHERFGPDFTGRPLIADWKSKRKIVLLGHSFGGATIRLFAEILAHGDEAEKAAAGLADPRAAAGLADPKTNAQADISPFFLGEGAERIHAIVTIAAPTNGTTAYDLHQDQSFDPASVKVSFWDNYWGRFFSGRKAAARDGRLPEDYAAFEMHIDNALALNKRIKMLPKTYYFAIPCSATKPAPEGGHRPAKAKMEPMFRKTSALMGAYSGRTACGFEIDKSWQENDGLVNTVSAMAPIGMPSEAFDRRHVRPGIWQVMPTYDGDHMSLQGGMAKYNNIRPFYLKLLRMIDTLPTVTVES